eukprot:3899892-Amphidinium_carterae.1
MLGVSHFNVHVALPTDLRLGTSTCELLQAGNPPPFAGRLVALQWHCGNGPQSSYQKSSRRVAQSPHPLVVTKSIRRPLAPTQPIPF